MDNAKEPKEIKLEINKKRLNYSATPQENITPAVKAIKKEKKFFNPEKLSIFFFYALVFLMPIAVFPLAVAPLASGKAVLFYGGVLLAAFFWVFSVFQKGSVKIPKSALFISGGAVVLVWLVSALFSGNASLSLSGKLYDLGAFSMMAVAFLSLFLGSVFFQSGKRIFVFYSLLFCSSFIAFLFQFFHVVFGIDIIYFNIFPANTSNLIGGWNDFSIFFGFIGLISLVFLETANFGKIAKLIFSVLFLMSFLAMAAVNFFDNWIVFGVFLLLVFVVSLLKTKKFLRPSLFAAIVVVFFILFQGTAIKINNILGTSFTEVRPSWSATLDITKKSLENNAILGTGPNTFLYNWLKFKPAVINNTVFWNARFVSGVGYFPSTMATTGVLGIAAAVIFLAIFLGYWRKKFFYDKNGAYSSGGQAEDSLIAASFLGAAYLWAFIVFYTPGFVVFTLAFIITGVFIGLMAKNGKIGSLEFSFSNPPAGRQGKTKTGAVFMFAAIILLVGLASLIYFYSQKIMALNNYSQALKIFEKTGDVGKTSEKLKKAVKRDKQDEYYRALSELGVISLSQIAANKDIPADRAIALFRDNLAITIAYAQEAVKINPADPFNWMQLGRVYESVVALKVEKADEAALNSYQEAAKVSPLDPLPFVASARVAAQTGKIDDARKYLESAINIKPDLADALFILSQIEAQAGNLKGAILRAEQTAALTPNNSGVFFQLGLLHYQNNNFNAARTAFEKAIGLNKDYANARYFLGLIYDRQGLKEKAIEQFANIATTNPNNEEVKNILDNLQSGQSALAEIAPPAPEKRGEPPISEEDQTGLKKPKKK